MSTWEHEDPKLWAEMPNAMHELMRTRVKAGLCAWCGKAFSEVIVVSPMFPSAGPFCRLECGDFDLRFYCITEGK